MKLNHLDFPVSDVPRAVALFESLLGFEVRSNRNSDAIVFLDDGHGFTLVLQKMKTAERYPENFHFGFLVDDPAQVHAFHEKAREQGIEIGDVVENGRGVLAYCRLWDGLLMEVSWHRPRE